MKLINYLLLPLVGVSMAINAAQLSQHTAIQIVKANDLAGSEQYQAAISLLNKVSTDREYDRAYIDRMLGVFYWQSGDISRAVKYLDQAVQSKLLDQQQWQTRKMLADLLVSQQHYQPALKHYYQLTASVPEDQSVAQLWLRIAQANYQLEQWQPVLAAVAEYRNKHLTPEVRPLSLQLGAQLQLQQWQPAIKTLEALIELEPGKLNWWRQLAGLQLQVNRPDKALATLSLASQAGLILSEQDLKMQAQLYAQQGIPEKGAEILQQLYRGSADQTILVQQAWYWQQAKEWQKAARVWSTAAQQDNKYYWNAAQQFIQAGQYQHVLQAIDKLNPAHRTEQVRLAKIRALYQLDRLQEAQAEANTLYEASGNKQAQNWIRYLSGVMRLNQSD